MTHKIHNDFKEYVYIPLSFLRPWVWVEGRVIVSQNRHVGSEVSLSLFLGLALRTALDAVQLWCLCRGMGDLPFAPPNLLSTLLPALCPDKGHMLLVDCGSGGTQIIPCEEKSILLNSWGSSVAIALHGSSVHGALMWLRETSTWLLTPSSTINSPDEPWHRAGIYSHSVPIWHIHHTPLLQTSLSESSNLVLPRTWAASQTSRSCPLHRLRAIPQAIFLAKQRGQLDVLLKFLPTWKIPFSFVFHHSHFIGKPYVHV